MADFVVDVSGRGSRAPRWLEAPGYEAPPESRVNAFVGYATRVYRRPQGFDADWRAATVRGIAPGNPRVGLLLPFEGKRWILTLAGYARDYPPTDEDGYLRYPTTEGGRPTPTARLIQKYIDRVMAVASEDLGVFAAFWEVVNMQAPPTGLFCGGCWWD